MHASSQIWGVLIGVPISAGLWIVGDWRKIGWCIGIFGQSAMALYALAVGQYILIVFSLLAGGAQLRHLIAWRHETWGRLPRVPVTGPCPTCTAQRAAEGAVARMGR